MDTLFDARAWFRQKLSAVLELGDVLREVEDDEKTSTAAFMLLEMMLDDSEHPSIRMFQPARLIPPQPGVACRIAQACAGVWRPAFMMPHCRTNPFLNPSINLFSLPYSAIQKRFSAHLDCPRRPSLEGYAKRVII